MPGNQTRVGSLKILMYQSKSTIQPPHHTTMRGDLFRINLALPNPSAGRPSDLLAIHPLAGYAVGQDIDSNRHIALLTNLTGEIIASIDEIACLRLVRR